MTLRAGLAGIALLAVSVAPAGETPLPPHPRLGWNPEMSATLARLRKQNSPEWQHFNEWIDAEKSGRKLYVATMGEETSALFGYLTTRDPALYDIAFSVLAPFVWRDPRQPARGLRPFFGKCPEAVYCDDHAAAYQGGELTYKIALLFDWAHERLTPAQRLDLIGWMNAACDFNHNRGPWAGAYFRNDGAGVLLGEAATVYATEGENPGASRIKGWFRSGWTETLKALDIMGRGGAMAEGNAYGEVTGEFLIEIANFVFYASGEDLFASHAWFRKRLAYDAFTVYPNPQQVPPGPPLEGAALGGDDSRGAWSWHSLQMRPAGLPLARHFVDTEEAAIWNWVFRQPDLDHGVDAWCDLFYYSPRPRLRKPGRLSWFDPSLGYVYVRSDWASHDATWISFWAGPHLDLHQHLDQGAFTIFKRRDLAIKSGNYDYNPLTAHNIAYYTRTVSANTLLIGNPKEYFGGFVAFYGCDAGQNHTLFALPDGSGKACPPNDGGERTMFPRSMALFSVADFEANRDDYDTARVSAFRDSGETVSWAADITNAYSNPRFTAPGTLPKVTRVWRRFTYLRTPDILLVADQVVSADERFPKSWLIHSVDRIEVGGQSKDIAPGESTHTGVRQARLIVDDREPSNLDEKSADLRAGYAELGLQTLFPVNVTYRLTGGREPAATQHRLQGASQPGELQEYHFHRHLRDFWVHDYSEGTLADHRSANWPPVYPQEMSRTEQLATFSGGYGRWRLAVEPGEARKSDIFLHLLSPSLKKNAPQPTAERLESQTDFGARVASGGRSWEIRWNKDKLTLPEIR